MVNLVLISGSLRAESLNSAAIRAVRREAATVGGVGEVTVLPLSGIPFYDGDVERAGTPAAVEAARALILAADAVIVCTPAYNGAIPGVLKNALDWLSRPAGQSALTGKVAAVLSASPGPRGGLEAQDGLRAVLARCRAVLAEHEPVALARAEQLRDETGEITDPAALRGLRALVLAAVAAARETADGSAVRA
jgi:chromate reductase